MLAIITARGGSKRLPGKNVKQLKGIPLIAYTIEAAKQSKYVDKVIVNTDDVEIAEVAIKFGAEVPFLRPEELATDRASSIDVLKHVMGWYTKQNIVIDEFVLLQPTSPFRTSVHIDEAIELFRLKNAQSVISYRKASHPLNWNKFMDEEGKVFDVFRTNNYPQELPQVAYLPNGALYVVRSSILESNSLYSDQTFGYIMDKSSSVDIDTIEDFEYAEFLMSKNEL